MFSQEEIIALKRYCQEITFKPAPLSGKNFVREGIFIWCKDWEIIEILKCLFHGEEVYLGDPPPNRLKHNPLWSQADIVAKAKEMKDKFVTAEKIIEELRRQRDVN